MKSMLVFMAFFALASASASEEAGEERFLVTTNTGSFLTLNSTTLTTVAIGGLLIVLVGLVLLGPGLVGDRFRANKRHGQAGQGFYSEEPEEFKTRYKRFAPNGNVAYLYCWPLANASNLDLDFENKPEDIGEFRTILSGL